MASCGASFPAMPVRPCRASVQGAMSALASQPRCFKHEGLPGSEVSRESSRLHGLHSAKRAPVILTSYRRLRRDGTEDPVDRQINHFTTSYTTRVNRVKRFNRRRSQLPPSIKCFTRPAAGTRQERPRTVPERLRVMAGGI